MKKGGPKTFELAFRPGFLLVSSFTRKKSTVYIPHMPEPHMPEPHPPPPPILGMFAPADSKRTASPCSNPAKRSPKKVSLSPYHYTRGRKSLLPAPMLRIIEKTFPHPHLYSYTGISLYLQLNTVVQLFSNKAFNFINARALWLTLFFSTGPISANSSSRVSSKKAGRTQTHPGRASLLVSAPALSP